MKRISSTPRPFFPALALLLILTVPLSAQTDPPWPAVPATGCSASTTPVTPMGIAQVGGRRYLAYGGNPGTRVMPIGVSPDNGCALYLGDPAICSQSIAWQTVIDNLAAAGLNRLRVWVAFGSANDSRNTPFRYYTNDSTNCPATMTTCFRLDQKNLGFFNRLRAVVDKARSKNMFVEITFFSPGWGDAVGSTFANGPWGGKGAYLSNGTIKPIKFSNPDNFVLDGQTGDDLIMQTQFQANVIKWTVGELWCYDNIWWEIANEPEGPSLSITRVANWQKARIANVVLEDSSTNYPLLQRPHLIAVNVFSQATAAEFLGPNNPSVSIVNGHYAEVVNGNNDSGALVYLAQQNLSARKVLGLNESKITKTSGAGDKAYTRSLTNGSTVAVYGGPEAARAEAWEFMLTRGGTVDHFGYLSGASPGTVGPIAAQMGKLKNFMLSVPINIAVGSTNPVPWVNIGVHPDPLHGIFPTWNATRGSYKYWGALQTPDGTASPNRYFALYLHNSAPRCKDQNVNYNAVNQCGSQGYLPINGPDARIWTTAGSKYKENNLQLNLGTAPGTFRICWYDPATLTVAAPKQICNWNGTSCGATVSSPEYSYDILLKIDEKSADPC